MKKSSDVDLSRGVFSCAGVEPTSIIRLFKFSQTPLMYGRSDITSPRLFKSGVGLQ